ncbi:hypothetical protein SAMN05216188_110261 [Lentzea xinjiangensis]|uniref:Uncharacterized protein n=2 Tax=Lentzea xinjiangensis TaxID=402600 RepID=A0A1H9NKN8_9PSEU|nr:hypothetical protein SAMN05216188_110261 [Lentzea xinjiangensis]
MTPTSEPGPIRTEPTLAELPQASSDLTGLLTEIRKRGPYARVVVDYGGPRAVRVGTPFLHGFDALAPGQEGPEVVFHPDETPGSKAGRASTPHRAVLSGLTNECESAV